MLFWQNRFSCLYLFFFFFFQAEDGIRDFCLSRGLGALLPVAVYPVSYSYPKLLAPALGFAAACWYCAKPDTPRAVLMAVAVAVAFLLRHDLGVFLGASVVAMMFAYHGVSRQALISA